MLSKSVIREIVLSKGADLFGVASVDRFEKAPEGFRPRDIYAPTESVLVFAFRLPSETLFADNPVPYTHMINLSIQKMDTITYEISLALDRSGIKNIPIPTDDPYLDWDEERQHGRAILSLRHAAQAAGLGVIGRNNLLINKDYGNMIQLGAILTKDKIEADHLAGYKVCPDTCRICIDSCPRQALTGTTVIQKECRILTTAKTSKGFTIKKCMDCRKKCPRVFGIKSS
jgi:epoxyqueuosine reductase